MGEISTVSVLLRNATNTGFEDKVNVGTNLYPGSISVGDFNNDGKDDFVVANHGYETVLVFLRNATNTGFDAQVDIPFARDAVPNSVSVGDFNNDGRSDLAVANYGNDTVSVLLNTSNPASHSALTIVEALNHAPTGSVILNNTTPKIGQTLVASNTLKDVDGLGAITYIWFANEQMVGEGDSYIVTTNDSDKFLSVIASYTDGLGNSESISSTKTSAVIPYPKVSLHAGSNPVEVTQFQYC